MACSRCVWQILDVGSVFMKEFASAFAAFTPSTSWSPVMSAVGAFQDWERTEVSEFPPLSIVHYPLQRGYHRAPFSSWLPYETRLLERLRHRTSEAAYSPLICTTPFYAPLAEKWPGPVIYYVTDRTAAFAGINAAQVIGLDRRLCRVAHAVCPNSSRLAEYLATAAGCSPAKITIVPNATRASNISPEALYVPGAPPADIADLPRPLIGVIGNQAANLDWELLAAVVQQTPRFSWVFVGPTSMPVPDPAQREARSWVMARARFTGSKPYGDLQAYARSLDAAVLPYRMQEPTYSGSSTRFYEHLAACRPMIATLAFHELLSKQPLVELVDTAAEMTAALARLEAVNFHDGIEEARWQASQNGTWEARARAVQTLVEPCPACRQARQASVEAPQPAMQSLRGYQQVGALLDRGDG